MNNKFCVFRFIGAFLLLAFFVASCQTVATPPIDDAVKAGDFAKVKQLIQKGNDVNEVTSDGSSPLHSAAENGFREMAELLLANGARINARNRKGITSLYLAARNGHSDLVGFL